MTLSVGDVQLYVKLGMFVALVGRAGEGSVK